MVVHFWIVGELHGTPVDPLGVTWTIRMDRRHAHLAVVLLRGVHYNYHYQAMITRDPSGNYPSSCRFCLLSFSFCSSLPCSLSVIVDERGIFAGP